MSYLLRKDNLQNVLATCTLEKIILIWKKLFANITFYPKTHKITLKYQWWTTLIPEEKNRFIRIYWFYFIGCDFISMICTFIFTVSWVLVLQLFLALECLYKLFPSFLNSLIIEIKVTNPFSEIWSQDTERVACPLVHPTVFYIVFQFLFILSTV